MGLLVDGKWQDSWFETTTLGRFVRQPSSFRSWITDDGSTHYVAEPQRYHLYASLACPWAHRTLILRQLKGLGDIVSLTIVDPRMGRNGWRFVSPEPMLGARYLHELYTRARRTYTGRVTVPVLWDRKTATIVNNESSEIIRMFNSAFDRCGADRGHDYYPEHRREAIDAINALVYEKVNNGVYRAGFATTQAAYDEAVKEVFEALDWLEARLSRQRFLVGDELTEADWRLFTTLVRFDAVYHGHFKCNIRRLVDYPALFAYTSRLYQVPGVAETVDMDHIKTHYYWSHDKLNPSRIVPRGPSPSFDLSPSQFPDLKARALPRKRSLQ